MAESITLPQFIYWVAFYRLEPWGQPWRRSGRQTALIATALGAKVNEDAEEMFLPTFDPARPKQTPEQMADELAKLERIMGAKRKKAN